VSNKLRVCGACGMLSRHVQMAPVEVRKALDLADCHPEHTPEWDAEGFVCLKCRSPWLVVWPEVTPEHLAALFPEFQSKEVR